MKCPCGSQTDADNCCQPIIKGQRSAPNAEALMRARYTAYTLADVDFLKNTLAPESRTDFDANATRKWAQESEWLGLEILSTDKGQSSDKKGTVELMVKYRNHKQVLEHHEVAQFRKSEKGEWFFVEGDSHTHKEGETHSHHHHAKPQTIVNEGPKIGRNDPCLCGSGKKYKKCCGQI